jgi:hypothetical protein
MYCFRRVGPGKQPPAIVWLAFLRGEELRVTQITPCETQALTVTECNEVMTDFYDTLVRPATDGEGVHVEFTGGTGLEESLRKAPLGRLHAFSQRANKNTGSANSFDHERWVAFLLAAHQDRSDLSDVQLAQWLRANGWGAEKADELALEYSFARALLRAYDQSRER